MWQVEGNPFDPARFSPFVPAEVLYEFDGPRIFTLKDTDGELNLAYWSDADGEVDRYVVVATSARVIALLRAGGISVLGALDQTRCWVCDIARDGSVTRCTRVEFDAIPRDALPADGALLWATLEPLRRGASARAG